ncbi:hypothetical protein HBH50_249730 [Parastagonospora nodorum]|nr:hypothetical protein HBH50_249730 [Parastagonospora nodorum]
MRLKKNVLGGPYRKIKLKRYASSNKETPIILLLQLLINNRTTLCSTPKIAPLLVCLSIATTPCRKVTAAYALNYLKLRNKFQFLSANIIALVGIVLYNAIKEYYNDRTRKIIYFYSHTVEDDYHDNDVDNILIKYECRTGYSNKKDIEADEREDKFAILAEEYIIDNCIVHALALTKDK